MAALWVNANLFIGALGPRALPAALVVLAVAGASQTWTYAL